MSQPDLTVVIPTLNEEGTIAACLDAIGHEDDVEVVVSDGGSTDGTGDLARASGRARVVQGSPGRGPQLRRGVAAASGSRLLLLHADCVLPNGWLAPLLAALTDPATALACYRLRTLPIGDGAGPLRRAWLRLLDLRSYGRSLPYGDQGYAVRRDVYDRVGGVPDIPLMEDVAFAKACRRQGRIVKIPLQVCTSARRFHRRPVRTRLITATFPFLFRIGFPPEILARWYGDVR